MKVVRKNVYIREDRIAASEQGASVDIRFFRSTVQIDAFIGATGVQVEVKLADLSGALIKAFGNKETRDIDL